MSTLAVCGSTGDTGFGGEVTKWTLNLTQDAIEATSMASSGWKESIGCNLGANGTFESLDLCATIGSTAAATFSNGLVDYTMDIIIKDIKTSTPVDGVVTFSYSFDVTGPVT